jgi:oxygen-independent coproporphyrinogen-3 oxidase
LSDGLLDAAAYEDGRAVLTLRGRLLADGVVRDLVD